MSETVVWILNPMHSQLHEFPKRVSVDVDYKNNNYQCCVKYILDESTYLMSRLFHTQQMKKKLRNNKE